MEIKTRTIVVQKSARYSLKLPDSGKADTVWLLIHGYAQLASDFLSEFEFIKNENHLLIAPEGLSKFYFRNKIGASWMTKEDRENEISDYINYLNLLMEKIKTEYDLKDATFNLLGFSQGVHTAVRFFIKGEYIFNNLILCSSDFPKDADFIKLQEKLNKSKMYFIHGTSDSAISNERFDESTKLLSQNKIEFEDKSFEGDHVLNKKFLNDLFCK
ncbi:MAG: hypothetical protein WAT71_16860 [Ignavibacteria bacterium]